MVRRSADEIVADRSIIFLIERQARRRRREGLNRGEAPIVGIDIESAFCAQIGEPKYVGALRGMASPRESPHDIDRKAPHDKGLGRCVVKQMIHEIGISVPPALHYRLDI